MPLGVSTITVDSADPACATLRAHLVDFLGLGEPAGAPDIIVAPGVPEREAAHVILSGPITEEVDAWDAGVAPQTVAGALWLVPGQSDPQWAAVAWLLLRLQSPATPLSDLTDANERSLRWSVVAAAGIAQQPAPTPDVDPDAVRRHVDAQPEVQELGRAVERLGGETAETVLSSAERFRAALTALGGPPPDLTAFDAAVAEHLRQVQRSGFGRWRGAKARAASSQAVADAGRAVAGHHLQAMLDRVAEEMSAAARAQVAAADVEALVTGVRDGLGGLVLPTEPDFARVPRSWAASAPAPRRYVFVAEGAADDVTATDATVRECPQVPEGSAVVALVQSGFSLPAVR